MQKHEQLYHIFVLITLRNYKNATMTNSKNHSIIPYKYIVVILTLFAVFYSKIEAQENSTAQANNPLANMTALNFHNYYIPKLNNAPDDAYLNTAWIRFAKPFADGKLLLRVSAPLNTIGSPTTSGLVQTESGLGDINAFLSYNFYSKPTGTIGIGPLLAAPTANEDALGSGKWQGGFAFVMFMAKSPAFQYGGLVTWQASFAGDDDRNSTNIGAIQPFFIWQLGKGTYLRHVPIWAFDFENDAYHIPLGLGIGKVVKMNNTVFNLFMEPQFSMLSKGTQPQMQLFAGINLQFISKNK
ncbi:MAG: hypothetical protein MI866_07270 [Bacteroidales bacterium]|nr:hypothetical protein [Bacteroidales bacterium]